MRKGVKSTKPLDLRARSTPLLVLDSTKYTNLSASTYVTKPEWQRYFERVEADGGTILDKPKTKAAIELAKSQGWLGICVAWFASYAGYRAAGSGIDKWYNMAGIESFAQTADVAIDAIQTSDSRRPTLSTSVSVLNNQPSMRFDVSVDQGKHFKIPQLSKHFANTLNGASVSVVHYSEGDGLYAVIGTRAADQWWTLGGTFMATFRSGRLNNVGTAAPTTGSQYTTIVSNSSAYKVYRNGVLDINTTADYYAGDPDFYISDTTGRDDRALKGYIPEVLFFRDPIDISSEIGTVMLQVEASFKSRYAL